MMPIVVNQEHEEVTWSLERAVSRYLEAKFKDGDMVSHDWLAYALELPKPSTMQEVMKAQWETLSRVEQFKKELLIKHKIALANVRGEGYRVVPPSDQAHYAVSVAMNGVRRELAKCGTLLKHTRTELLDNEGRKRHTDAQVKMAALSGMARREKRDVLKLFDKQNEGARSD